MATIRERSKVYTSVISTEENGEAVVKIPDALTENLRWREGDALLLRARRHSLKIENLSVKTLYLSRMQRELNSISRRLGNPIDPLDRVHVKKRRVKRDLNFTVLLSPREWDMLQAQPT